MKYLNKRAPQLPALNPGDHVLIRDEGEKYWKRSGVVFEQYAPNSFVIRTDQGKIRWNRIHLRPDIARVNIEPGTVKPHFKVKTEEEDMDSVYPESNTTETTTVEPPIQGSYTTRFGRRVKQPERFTNQ